MYAEIGDRLHKHGRIVGQADAYAEIIEVLGSDGGPPYRVRYPDGSESLCSPGSDSVVESPGGAVRR